MSPERKRIAKIFYTHIKSAIDEIGLGYEVTLEGKFDKTPIRIEIQLPQTQKKFHNIHGSTPRERARKEILSGKTR